MSDIQKPASTASQAQGLQGEVTVELHTHYAVRAVRGRKKTDEQNQIIGLYQFTSRMNTIYQAAGNDDPFALFVLVGLEAELSRVSKRLATRQQRIDECLAEHNDQISIEKAKSTKPEVLSVNVSHYGFKVLDLIVMMDKLCCDALNAIHRSRITTREGKQITEKSAEDIRGLLSSGSFYRFTGIDREDLRQKNQRAQQAVEKLIESRFINSQHFGGFDDISSFFANYEQAAEFGPEIKARSQNDKAQTKESDEIDAGENKEIQQPDASNSAKEDPHTSSAAATDSEETTVAPVTKTKKKTSSKKASKKKQTAKKLTAPDSEPTAEAQIDMAANG